MISTAAWLPPIEEEIVPVRPPANAVALMGGHERNCVWRIENGTANIAQLSDERHGPARIASSDIVTDALEISLGFSRDNRNHPASACVSARYFASSRSKILNAGFTLPASA
jgi:hypothetical protein